jgi:TatD DNase family protein
MNYPQPGDYINIHSHGDLPAAGIFTLLNIMAHEDTLPVTTEGLAYSFGIHPWFLDENNQNQQLNSVINIAGNPLIAAIGEAGFDKIKGPSMDLQSKIFEAQIAISEEHKKPLIIHCVRAWDELLAARKKLKPVMPWMVHGFRGNPKLAEQLISKGLYLSFWFNYILRPESADLLKSIPKDRIFLESDGAEVNIADIYNKVSVDLKISVEDLKSMILSNYFNFFNH